MAKSSDANQLLRDLQERVKEAAALHEVARLIRRNDLEIPELLRHIAALIPPAFQYPEVTAAAARYGDIDVTTPGFGPDGERMRADFTMQDGVPGSIEVMYCEPRPAETEGPFLAEERLLLDSIADILCAMLDRRISDRALEQSNQRLKLAQSAAGMGVWEWDMVADRVAWSVELAALAGIEPGVFPGTFAEFLTLFHPDDRHALELLVRRALNDHQGGDAFNAEFRVLRSDGATRWLAANGRVLRNAEGRPVRMLGMAHDITATHDLEQRLHESQKLDALGRMAGSVAHDFNNLLTAVAGYADLLLTELPPDIPYRHDIEEIARAADRATELTRQLLAFARRQDLAPRIVDPNDLLAGMRRLIEHMLGRDVQLRVTLDENVGTIRVDPNQFGQIIMNLAVNARDAMPEGGTLEIRSQLVTVADGVDLNPDLSPGEYICISITDDGVGMTPDVESRLFEPFFTTKTHEGGTGLGLSTVYGIVQQSNGAIRVSSQLGRGSTFRVFLPRAE